MAVPQVTPPRLSHVVIRAGALPGYFSACTLIVQPQLCVWEGRGWVCSFVVSLSWVVFVGWLLVVVCGGVDAGDLMVASALSWTVVVLLVVGLGVCLLPVSVRLYPLG